MPFSIAGCAKTRRILFRATLLAIRRFRIYFEVDLHLQGRKPSETQVLACLEAFTKRKQTTDDLRNWNSPLLTFSTERIFFFFAQSFPFRESFFPLSCDRRTLISRYFDFTGRSHPSFRINVSSLCFSTNFTLLYRNRYTLLQGRSPIVTRAAEHFSLFLADIVYRSYVLLLL